MKKFLTPIIFMALLVFTVTANGPTKIPYYQAVELAMCSLTVLEMEELIEELEERQLELRADIRRFNRGDMTNQLLNTLLEELAELDALIFSTLQAQGQLQLNTEQEILNIFQNLQDQNDADYFGRTLDSLLGLMLTQQNMDSNLSAMYGRVAEIFAEIVYLQENPDIVQNIIDEATRYLREMDNHITHQISTLRLQHEQSALSTEHNLRLLMFAVSELTLSIETQAAELTLTRENTRRITVRHSLGLASSNELRRATQTESLEEMALARRQANLENALNSLNYLLGQPLYQQTIIEFDREIKTKAELTYFYYEIMYTPQVRLQQMYVDIEGVELRSFRGSDMRARAARQESYRRATERRDNRAQTISAAFSRGLNDFANLETLLEGNELEIYSALRALETVETNLGLGRATRHDVAEAEFAVFRLRQLRESIYNEMWLLGFRLANPALL